VDPLILSTLTGTLAARTQDRVQPPRVAAAKLEMLQRLPVRLLGAILNDVPAGGAYRYYSYYLPGYEARRRTAEAGGFPSKEWKGWGWRLRPKHRSQPLESARPVRTAAAARTKRSTGSIGA